MSNAEGTLGGQVIEVSLEQIPTAVLWKRIWQLQEKKSLNALEASDFKLFTDELRRRR